MTDKEKLEKVVKLADAMYYAAQCLTTDASRLHKAMEEYHQFIITEYNKQETAKENLEDTLKAKVDEELKDPVFGKLINTFAAYAFAKQIVNWHKEQMLKNAVDATVTSIREYREENEVDFTIMLDKGVIPYVSEENVKLIITKE